MVKQEKEIRERIDYLNSRLQQNEEAYKTADIFVKDRLLVQSYNIESQLEALHFVLGERYVYKH